MTTKNPTQPGKLVQRWTLQLAATCTCDDEHLEDLKKEFSETWIQQCNRCRQVTVIGYVTKHDSLEDLWVTVDQLTKELS
jgi:hypothetical protein